MFSKAFICAQKEPCTHEHHVAAPLLRKNFLIEKLENAYCITICGLGFYRLFINGIEITKGFFAPYISSPNDFIYYDKYEIASYLKEGNNVIGIMLGNGFENAMDNGVWDFQKAAWRSAPKCAFSVETVEGKLFESDLTVKCCNSPITYDDLRCGERYNATFEIDNWASPNFDDSAWKQVIFADAPQGEPKLVEAEPIVNYRTISPVKIEKGKKGYIFDFGEVNAGVCKIQGVAEKGQKIKLTHGEIVIDGALDLKNISFGDRSKTDYVQHDEYIAKGGYFTYVPSFTYHGFRYVEVEGITEEQATKEFLTFLVLGSNLERAGDFTCDNEEINKIQECTYRSNRSNIFYFPLDCPQREKNGWTGDTALSAEQFFYNLQVEKSLTEWLCNIRKAQRDDGKLPGIVPTSGWGYAFQNGPAWDLVLVEIPYRIYQFTGNLQPTLDTLSAFERYLDCAKSRQKDNGLVEYGLGDWCETGTADEGLYSTSSEITDSIILCDMCRKIAYLSGKAKNVRLQRKAEGFAEELREKFREKYVENGRLSVETQTAYALALFHDFFEKEEKALAYERLKCLIAQKEDHFCAGVLGTRVLFYVLSEMGDSALAIKLITQKTFPSYTYHIDRGATTLWEAFHLLDDEKPYLCRKDGNPRLLSLNHHFWGFVSGWFYSCLAGIKLEDANIYVSPCFDCGLTHVKASYNGKSFVEVDWEKQVNGYLLNVVGEAKFVLPKGYKIKAQLPTQEGISYLVICDGDDIEKV